MTSAHWQRQSTPHKTDLNSTKSLDSKLNENGRREWYHQLIRDEHLAFFTDPTMYRAELIKSQSTKSYSKIQLQSYPRV